MRCEKQIHEKRTYKYFEEMNQYPYEKIEKSTTIKKKK